VGVKQEKHFLNFLFFIFLSHSIIVFKKDGEGHKNLLIIIPVAFILQNRGGFLISENDALPALNLLVT